MRCDRFSIACGISTYAIILQTQYRAWAVTDNFGVALELKNWSIPSALTRNSIASRHQSSCIDRPVQCSRRRGDARRHPFLAAGANRRKRTEARHFRRKRRGPAAATPGRRGSRRAAAALQTPAVESGGPAAGPRTDRLPTPPEHRHSILPAGQLRGLGIPN